MCRNSQTEGLWVREVRGGADGVENEVFQKGRPRRVAWLESRVSNGERQEILSLRKR